MKKIKCGNCGAMINIFGYIFRCENCNHPIDDNGSPLIKTSMEYENDDVALPIWRTGDYDYFIECQTGLIHKEWRHIFIDKEYQDEHSFWIYDYKEDRYVR